MSTDHSAYLASIGMEEPFINRVIQICDRFRNLTNIDIEDIFVSEYINDEGNRVYEDLRIFASGWIAEADQFLSNDELFFTNIDELQSVGLSISSKDFDFGSTSSSSRLTARLLYTGDFYISFKSSEENCQNLVSIIRKYLLKSDSSC